MVLYGCGELEGSVNMVAKLTYSGPSRPWHARIDQGENKQPELRIPNPEAHVASPQSPYVSSMLFSRE